MDLNDFWEENKVKIIIFLFFVLAIIYFASLLTPAKMMHGTDFLMSGYPNKKTNIDFIKNNGRLQMWDSHNFSGHPTIATKGAGGIVYPLNILMFIFPVHYGWTLLYLIHVFLAGLGMWLLLREYKISHLASLVGAVAFMFAGQLITTTHGGHFARMVGAIILPYSFLFLYRALNRKRLVDFIIFGGITGLMLLAGHVQISYWAMIGVFFYFVYELIRRRKEIKWGGSAKLTGFFTAGIILAVLLVSMKLLPPALSLGYGARGATRGYEYTTSWSVPTSELTNLIAPHFSGILDNYWGENYFKLDSRYLGILPLILLGSAFLYRKKRYLIKYFGWFTVITLILALGKNTPLFRIYYYLVPMAEKFRAPSMFFFLTSFGISALAGFGAQTIINFSEEGDSEKKNKYLLYLFIVSGIIALAAAIIHVGDRSILNSLQNHFRSSWAGEMQRQRIQQKLHYMGNNFGNFKKSLWIAAFLFLANAWLIWGIVRKKLSYRIAFPVMLLILLFDLWGIDKKYLSAAPHPDRYYAPDRNTRELMKDSGTFRIFPFRHEKSKSGYFQLNGIRSIAGLGPNPPKRYQQFIGAGSSVMFEGPNLISYPHLLSMLNVKYILCPSLPEDLSRYNERVREVVKQYREFYSNFQEEYVSGRYQILENENFLPLASLISNCRVMDDPEQILNRILSPEYTPGDTVYLEESVDFRNTEIDGKVKLEKFGQNVKILEVKTGKPAFLIIRENYHPDWKAFIDGKKTEVYRANYVFYGVFVPEGNHRVKFEYKSSVVTLAGTFSFSGLVIFLMSLIVFFILKKRRDKKSVNKVEKTPD